MEQTIIILKGLPASGKTTWATRECKQEPENWIRINRDDLRGMMYDGYYSKGTEELVKRVRDEIFIISLVNGKSVIIDDTNLKGDAFKYFQKLKNKHKGLLHIPMEERDWTATVEECIGGDTKRLFSVGEKVIMDMYEKYVKEKE